MASCPKQEAIPYKLATSKHVCLLIKAIFVTKNIRLSLKFLKSQVKNTKINGISVFGRVKTRLSAGSTTKNYNPLGKLYGSMQSKPETFWFTHKTVFPGNHGMEVKVIYLKIFDILCVCVSHLVVTNSLWPHGLWPTRLLCPWDSPGKNTGVGCHFLLQGIFWTKGLNPGLL